MRVSGKRESIRKGSDAKMLSREQVRSAIRFACPPRPPRAFTKWWGEGLEEQYGEELSRFDAYEEDVTVVPFPCPAVTPRADGFYWRLPQLGERRKVGHDANALLPIGRICPRCWRICRIRKRRACSMKPRAARVPRTKRGNTC